MNLNTILDSILNTHKYTSAIITAAGSSRRMGMSTTKQTYEILGIPVAVHSILAFEKSNFINEIIVVARKDEIEIFNEYVNKYSLSKVTNIVCGGETRQDSVLEGFKKISDKSKFVAIHDGARCLITPQQIESVLKEAYRSGAATAATKATDTIKVSDSLYNVKETLDRDKIWLVQTPQCFMTNMYRASVYTAKKDGFVGTDDCSLVEHAGFPIKLCDCTSENIKITTKIDLTVAQAILKNREERNDL